MPAKSIPVAKTCEVCGVSFEVKPSRANKAHYCSRACLGRAKSDAGLNARPRKPCAHCGRLFSVVPNRLSVALYCSRTCHAAAQTGITHTDPIVGTCEVCGSEYVVKPYRASNRRFCSLRCYGVAQQGTIKASASGRTVSRGYVYLKRPDHPAANKYGYVAEHRLVAEAHLGRYLTPKEIVHHKDGDTSRNEWDNLEVMTQSEHARLHHARKD